MRFKSTKLFNRPMTIAESKEKMIYYIGLLVKSR